MFGEWLYPAVAVVTVVHLAMLVYAYRNRKRLRGGARDAVGEQGGDADGRVACPTCGVDNEAGYRYCRACVTELPGAVSFRGEGGPPDRRRTL
jgi:hypothetical protein